MPLGIPAARAHTVSCPGGRRRAPGSATASAWNRRMKDRSTVHTLFDIEETPVDDATAFLGRKTAHLYLWWRHVGGDGAPPKRSFDITEQDRKSTRLDPVNNAHHV